MAGAIGGLRNENLSSALHRREEEREDLFNCHSKSKPNSERDDLSELLLDLSKYLG